MRHTLLLLFSLLWTGILFADNVPVEKAQAVAESFFQTNHPQRMSAPNLRMVWDGESPSTRAQGAAPAYYVFNNPDGKGFVIVAGDDIAQPILGYSFENSFNQENMPPNLKGWMEGLHEEINGARRNGMTRSTETSRQWASTRAGEVVVQLETAKWSQDSPYNNQCPVINGENALTGCSATATAIVMRYHQWPDCGVGVIKGYISQKENLTLPDRTLGHSYQWDKMLMQYSRNQTGVEAEAVATLMSDCALMIQSDFGISATSSSMPKVISGLTTFMKYDKSALYLIRGCYTTQQWYQKLKKDLDGKRPVIYDGSGSGGHMFVLDGYTSDNYFSVNWGWSGYCNGYYSLSAMYPADDKGPVGHDYNKSQSAIIGLKPDERGEAEDNLTIARFTSSTTGETYNGLYATTSSFKKGVPFDLYVGIANIGLIAFDGEINFSLRDKSGKFKVALADYTTGEDYVINYSNRPLQPGYIRSITAQNLYIPVEPEVGDRIRVFYRSSRTNWTQVRGDEESGYVWELLVGDALTIEESTSLSYSKEDKILRITVKSGVEINVSGPAGAVSVLGSDTSYYVETDGLPAGDYTLTLTKGTEQKEMIISLGTTQNQ